MTRLNKVIELQLDGKTWIADRIDPNKLGSWSIRQFLGEAQCPVVTDVCSCLLVDWHALASIFADPPWKHRSDMLQPRWVTRTHVLDCLPNCHNQSGLLNEERSQAMCVSSLAGSNRSVDCEKDATHLEVCRISTVTPSIHSSSSSLLLASSPSLLVAMTVVKSERFHQ